MRGGVTPLVDVDERADLRLVEDRREILIRDANTAVGDVLAEKAPIERSVDEVPIPEIERVAPHRRVIEAVGVVPLRDRLSLLDERPVRLHPNGVLDLPLDVEGSGRRRE